MRYKKLILIGALTEFLLSKGVSNKSSLTYFRKCFGGVKRKFSDVFRGIEIGH